MTLSELIHWNQPSKIPVQRSDRLGRSLLSMQDSMDELFQNVLSQ